MERPSQHLSPCLRALLGLPILVSPSLSARWDPEFSSGFLRKGTWEIICAEFLFIEDLTECLLETGC